MVDYRMFVRNKMTQLKNIDDLIECLENESAEAFANDVLFEGNYHRVREEILLELLEKAKELKANMEADGGWVNVEDTLPNPCVEMLVIRDGMVTIGYFRNNKWITRFSTFENNITHWRPLPSPPKGEK